MNKDRITFLKNKFGIQTKENEKTITDYLLEIPKKEKRIDTATTDVFERNNTHQIDLLYLPDDKGFKYALVCVDLAYPRYIGVEKLKTKTPEVVQIALLQIYKKYKKFLKLPKILECDMGSEFKGEFMNYFNKKGVYIRYKRTGRHRQQACVESVNGMLVHGLFYTMLANEIHLEKKEIVGDWIDNIDELVELLNFMKSEMPKEQIKNDKRSKLSDNGKWIIATGDNQVILPVDTKVRVILEEPRNIQGDKQHGKFRKGDIRWENKTREIEQISMRPNQPPMYLVDGINNVAYTKEQLQVINPNEKPPKEESITHHIVEKITDKRKYKNKVQYLVKFKNIKIPTWENADGLPKQMINDYNKSLK
jgi:hypothetical protein